jgi:hypothetical protein
MKLDSPRALKQLNVSGSASISGSLTVGDDILPSVPDQIDIGSDTQRFRDIYLSGSTIFLGNVKLSEGDDGGLKVVDSSENIISIDTSLNDRIDSLETESGSIRSAFEDYTSSADLRLDSLEIESGSVRTELNNYTSSADLRLDSLEVESGSIRTELNNYTSSTDLRLDSLEIESGSIRGTFDNYTSSADLRLDSLETESGSIRTELNNYTSSVDEALTFNNKDITAKGNITVTGDLLVQGTQSIFNTEQFSVENNVIELNTAGAIKGGILVGDITAPSELSGSLLWNGADDHWVAGISGSEQKIILENVFTSYTSSADNRLLSLEVESGSIRTTFNNYTGSANLRLDSLEIESGSIRTTLNNFTGSLGNISTQSSGSVSITGGSINGTSIGATSTSTGAFTDLSYTGTLTGGTGAITIGTNQFVKDANGNVGIGTNSPGSYGNDGKLTIQTNSATNGIVATFANGGSTGAAIQLFQNGVDVATIGMPAGSAGITFTVSTTERMRIDSAGNVGIGSTNPGARLAIRGIGTTSATFALDVANVNGNTHMAVRDDGEVIFFGSSLSETLRLTAAGNLLPGSNNAYDLGATGSRFRDGWFARDVSAGGTLRQSGAIGSGTANTTVIANSSGQAQIWALGPDTSTRGSILFVVARSDLTSSIESLRIDSAGNVGIGTSSPSVRLAVVGGVNASRFTRAGATAITNGGGITLGTDFNTAGCLLAGTGNQDFIVFGSSDTTDPTGGTLTERLRIDSAGNVGIGTDAPSARLDVRVPGNGGSTSTADNSIFLAPASPAQITANEIGTQIILNAKRTGVTDGAAIAAINDGANFDQAALAFYTHINASGVPRTERLRIQSLGTVQLPSGSPGIKFGTRNANLADYEEGTWTPTVTSAGYTASASSGTYTKIGNIVNIRGSITFSAVNASSTSRADIGGLPFTPAATTAGSCREDTAIGAVFAFRVDPTFTVINSMDGVVTDSNSIFATSRDYTMNATYQVS